MEPAPSHYPSLRFFAFLVLGGGFVGLILLLAGAPFWLFYVAPILVAPLILRELNRLGQADQGEDSSPPLRLVPWVEQMEEQGLERLREHWLVVGAGAVTALVSAFSFVHGEELVGFLAAGTAAMLLGVFSWQVGHGEVSLEIDGGFGQQLIFASAERRGEVPADASALIVHLNEQWVLVPRDRPSEKLYPFDTEEAVTSAAQDYVAEHGGRFYRSELDWDLMMKLIVESLEEDGDS
jgi:hypothetical protein